MREKPILRARPDDDTLGSDKNSPVEGSEGKERIKYIQPKAQDANEVERLGLMKVPRRFSFSEAKEAVNFGLEIIARSEHPGEAEGLSGVNPSYTFGKDYTIPEETEKDFRAAMLQSGHYDGTAHVFCEINGLDKEQYDRGLSWSFWEKMPGVNLSVLEDNTIQGRYWILATWPYQKTADGEPAEDETESSSKTFLFEDGQIKEPARHQYSHLYPIPAHLKSKMGEIVESYKKIKEHFGIDTSWIVEMQLPKSGDLYFLQRHPTRQYESCDWKFDSEPESDEIVIHAEPDTIVRGATPKEGWEMDMIYGGRGRAAELPQQEVYTRSTAVNPVWFQKWIARSKLFIETNGTSSGEANNPHSSVIPLTKPNVYLSFPDFRNRIGSQWTSKMEEVSSKKQQARVQNMDALGVKVDAGEISSDERDRQDSLYMQNPENRPKIKMRVRSDGTEARIKILDIH